MKLNAQTIAKRRAALLCPAGEHRARMVSARSAVKPSGRWVEIHYRTDEGDFDIREDILVKPARRDLEGMSLDHLERLLQAIEATLGVDEVEDLAAALAGMEGKPVLIEVCHQDDRQGKARAHIRAWRAAP